MDKVSNMMSQFERYSNSNVMAIDEEQLKTIVGVIKRYATDLNKIKNRSDVVWEQCSSYLDDSVSANINEIKASNVTKYTSAMEELIAYANKLESISNIWKEAETEISTSSKNLESIFEEISKNILNTIEQNK